MMRGIFLLRLPIDRSSTREKLAVMIHSSRACERDSAFFFLTHVMCIKKDLQNTTKKSLSKTPFFLSKVIKICLAFTITQRARDRATKKDSKTSRETQKAREKKQRQRKETCTVSRGRRREKKREAKRRCVLKFELTLSSTSSSSFPYF